jgi:hypothetical protein
MHRLSFFLVAGSLVATAPLAFFACGGNKKPAAHTEHAGEGSSEGDAGGGSADNAGGADGGKDDCVGFEVDKLDEALMKASCENPNNAAASQSVDMKDKLEIRAMPFPTKVAGGGTMEIVVSFVNKGKAPLTLNFMIDPEPHFTVEAYDAKNNRADMPKGNPPPLPKDVTPPPDPEQKYAHYTIAPNGVGKVKLNWTATKMKWAPEKAKGAILSRGFPRAPNGNLPKGKYTLRIVTPLVGVSEGMEKEISAPKIPIEVE